MATTETDLPEGTDTVIAGCAETSTTAPRSSEDRLTSATDRRLAAAGDNWRTHPQRRASKSPARPAKRPAVSSRQGLERTAEALANVSKMVGDTAPGIDERLGDEYGDYARRAAGAIENAANTIADKGSR